MPKTSAGILIYRNVGKGLEVLLVHPGGPFWATKDLEAWSIPKGEPEEGEDLLAAARRELAEETGFSVSGAAMPLGQVRQKSGKVVHAWAIAGDVDAGELRSNSFELEWPPGSKRVQAFPEIDRAEWFGMAEARHRINPAQRAFLDRLESKLASSAGRGPGNAAPSR